MFGLLSKSSLFSFNSLFKVGLNKAMHFTFTFFPIITYLKNCLLGFASQNYGLLSSPHLVAVLHFDSAIHDRSCMVDKCPILWMKIDCSLSSWFILLFIVVFICHLMEDLNLLRIFLYKNFTDYEYYEKIRPVRNQTYIFYETAKIHKFEHRSDLKFQQRSLIDHRSKWYCLYVKISIQLVSL